MRTLRKRILELAEEYRDVTCTIQDQKEIVKEYKSVIRRLYELGWDGTLDSAARLPDQLMPQQYKDRHLEFS